MTMISRQDAEALIQAQVQKSILQDSPKNSVVFQLAKKLPNMTSNTTRMKVLDLLPTAYWVNGDTGMKKTSKQAWDNVYLTAAELAVIVPIPDAVMNDAEIDIMGEVLPRINESIGQCVDSAILFGVNKPIEWESDVITRARQANNNVAPGSKDMYDLTLGENGVFDKVEEFGYMITGAIASTSMKSKLRGLRDANKQPIFKNDMQGTTNYALDGAPLHFPQNGSFDKAIAQMIVGDFTNLVYAIRQDVTVKILTEGVIQDPQTKEIVYNLAQQDMTALRVVFRMGWALPNPATRLDGDRMSCPFAYLEPGTPVTTQKVTFTVKDNADTAAEIQGVKVTLAGAVKKTNASGVVEFNLRKGNYTAKFVKEGYTQVTSEIAVDATAVTKDIVLNIKN